MAVVTLILGTLILADLLICCVLMFIDIHEECEWQMIAAELDEERRRNGEAMSPDGAAE